MRTFVCARAPEVLRGQLAAQQHGRVLADGLLDHPAALADARDDLEHAVPRLGGRRIVAAARLQEAARACQQYVSADCSLSEVLCACTRLQPVTVPRLQLRLRPLALVQCNTLDSVAGLSHDSLGGSITTAGMPLSYASQCIVNITI
jgi:hypothetical protein